MIYVCQVFGWMTLIQCKTKREALTIAKDRAESASMLRSDVTARHIHRAEPHDVAWFRAMGGQVD